MFQGQISMSQIYLGIFENDFPLRLGSGAQLLIFDEYLFLSYYLRSCNKSHKVHIF